MKRFHSGDVVPECVAKFTGGTTEAIQAAVGRRAKFDHGITEISQSLIDQVLANIQEEPGSLYV